MDEGSRGANPGLQHTTATLSGSMVTTRRNLHTEDRPPPCPIRAFASLPRWQTWGSARMRLRSKIHRQVCMPRVTEGSRSATRQRRTQGQTVTKLAKATAPQGKNGALTHARLPRVIHVGVRLERGMSCFQLSFSNEPACMCISFVDINKDTDLQLRIVSISPEVTCKYTYICKKMLLRVSKFWR